MIIFVFVFFFVVCLFVHLLLFYDFWLYCRGCISCVFTIDQDCEAHVKAMDAGGKQVVPESGKQELYEMILNHYV